MGFIAFFLLTGPGITAWFVEGKTKLNKYSDVLIAIAKWIVNNFVILTLSYCILFLAYGKIDIAFASLLTDHFWNTIYDVNFVAKYGAMTLLLAIMLGVFEKLLSKVVTNLKRSM